jgi:2,3-bisphosphoglycerate-independent phosphoglycerate mutase
MVKKYNYKPVVLIVLDGFGITTEAVESPRQLSKHPVFDEIERFWPFTALQASGIAVGLPWAEEGNSEVGHLTMASGRIIYHHLPRIITSIKEGGFFKNEALLKATSHVKEKKSALHFMGIFSSGTVHAYPEHFYALLDLAKQEKIERVCLHLFTDGRDAPPNEAKIFLRNLEDNLKEKYPMAKIASLIGRHYAMDRDGNWDRIEKTYKLLTEGGFQKFQTPSLCLEEQYKNGLSDEFIFPSEASAKEGELSSRIKNGDAVVFVNFRGDSARELTAAFTDKEFSKFERKYIDDLVFVTMTEYDKKFSLPAAFPAPDVKWPLPAILSQAGYSQLRIAETNKYAHVTYFFNAGWEEPFQNEDRILIPSISNVSYDQEPQMSALAITETLLSNIGNYDFILVNFANADMVGHTGNFNACIRAIEILDSCVGEIIPAVLEVGGIMIITADHGNIEEKIYKFTGEKRTEHSANPVPFYLVGKDLRRENPRTESEITDIYKKTEGTLTDIAPTILELMNLKKPVEMTGKSLLPKLLNR